MKKYAKIINDETKQCEVGLGSDVNFYKKIGMIEMAVEQGYDGNWYLEGYAPSKPQELIDEEEIASLKQYLNNTDWYYSRQLETGEVIPDNVREKRIEARNRINELEDRNSQE